MATPPPAPPQPPVPARTPRQLWHEKEQREFRRARRKARERAGEVKELNITAMMDMMTIILVFLLKSYTASSLDVNLSEKLSIPQSTAVEKPVDVIKVTISLSDVSVNDRIAVQVKDGIIPANLKENDFYIGSLYDALKREVDKHKKIAEYNADARKVVGRVNVVADKRIPYRTLIDVLFTAGRAELGEYQFMVLKND
jgi:biopolymer transport protein ExbD